MFSFLFDLVSSVFKPSVAALAIAGAIAMMTFENNPNSVSISAFQGVEFSCQGVFQTLCNLGSF